MANWLDRILDSRGRSTRPRRQPRPAPGPQARPAPPPEVPDPIYVPRRPARERQGGGPGGTVSALVFLLVTLSLCGGLIYGFQWAVGTEGGILSGAFGSVIATPSPTPNRGALKLATATATLEASQAGEAPDSATPAPESSSAAEATPTPARRVHVVEAGDTPVKLAQTY